MAAAEASTPASKLDRLAILLITPNVPMQFSDSIQILAILETLYSIIVFQSSKSLQNGMNNSLIMSDVVRRELLTPGFEPVNETKRFV